MKKLNLFLVLSLIIVLACKKDKTYEPILNPDPVDTTDTEYTDINNTYGFGILNKLKGIWNGPVSSTTPLGGYTEWIVDFRPISNNQISAKNELDTLNDIHMSFFIAKYNNQFKVCFRNGGSFDGQTRVSYFLVDSVLENSSQSYYKFNEIIKGESRAYSEVIFKQDSLIMKTYTNHYNTLSTPSLHMTWSAKLQDTSSYQNAVSLFDFPKKVLSKDFSSTFTSQEETVYYSIGGGDPYTESQQPYLGKTNITYTYSGTYSPESSKKVFIMITTKPLISGFLINTEHLKTRSRYVILAANDTDFTFNYMHPGSYYIYALYDTDGNNNFSSGDWVSSTNTSFTLSSLGTTNTTTEINFTIP